MATDETAVRVVQVYQATRQPERIYVKSKLPCLDGTLYFMHWTSGTEKRDFDAYVFSRPMMSRGNSGGVTISPSTPLPTDLTRLWSDSSGTSQT